MAQISSPERPVALRARWDHSPREYPACPEQILRLPDCVKAKDRKHPSGRHSRLIGSLEVLNWTQDPSPCGDRRCSGCCINETELRCCPRLAADWQLYDVVEVA